MKSISNIFEGIFNQDSNRLENQAIISNPDSKFNKEWAYQFGDPRRLTFSIIDDILHIDCDNNWQMYGEFDFKLSKYLDSIRGICLNGEAHLGLNGHVLDDQIFGNTIKSPRTPIYIFDAPAIDNITIEADEQSIYIFDCQSIKNCIFDKVTNMVVYNLSGFDIFHRCKALDLKSLTYEGANIFKSDWAKLVDLIDWSELKEPVNLKNNMPVKFTSKSLVKLVSIVKNMYNYSWHGNCQLPVKEKGNKLIQRLFPDCIFPELRFIYIRGGDVNLEFFMDKYSNWDVNIFHKKATKSVSHGRIGRYI